MFQIFGKWKREVPLQPCPQMGCHVPGCVHRGHCLFTKPLVCGFAAVGYTEDSFINNLIPNGKMKK